MSTQIKFFKRNKLDIQNTNVSTIITDSVATSTGSDIFNFVRNRNNRSAWVTTGSSDAGTTTIEVNMGDFENVDTIILVKHNLKAFTIQYWDGLIYKDFPTPINETVNADDTSHFNFTSVSAQKIKLVITGTQTADTDKEMYQFIVAETLGQLEAWPEIKKPKHVSNQIKQTMLSGKINVVQPVGRFSCQLAVKYWSNDDDLAMVERLYFDRAPVLVWLCGGDENQFRNKRRGYRLEDLYLMRPVDDYSPEWVDYTYTTGLKLAINLDEVVD